MIDTSAVVGAALLAIEILMRQVHWETIPADDSKAAQDVAEFVDGCRHDMATSWEDFVGDHLGFLPWGWQWYEFEYKLREGPQDELTQQLRRSEQNDNTPIQPSSQFSDGKFGWHRFGLRGQESLLRWEFTPDGRELLGMWQIPAPTYQLLFVPYAKSMNFRTTTRKDSPEGRSIFRNAWMAHKFSKNIMVQEGIGIERDLAGLPVAKVPLDLLATDATASDAALYATIEKIVRNIRRDEQEGVVWPLDYDEAGNERFKLELLSSGGMRSFDTNAIIGRYEQRMLMVALQDFLLIGSSAQSGSRALVDPRMNLASITGEAYLRQSASTLNSRAVPQLLTLNRMSLELAPKLTPGRVNLTRLLDLANYVLAISQANQASPLAPDVRQELLRRGDLPTADTGATVEDSAPNQGQQQPAPETEQQEAETDAAQAKQATYPETWPDWVVHTADDLMQQRPADISPRVWADIVTSQAQAAVRAEQQREPRRVFDMAARS